MMENAEEVMHSLEEFSKLKPKEIPRELEDYLRYVAKTGDPVFKWSLVKPLFHEKLVNVVTDFSERTLTIELPPCPNVDPFNYERMKANLIEKLDSFPGAPFTIQRLSELLTNPSKEYKRADKFMRAVEKNILVVSIREPGKQVESDSDSQMETSFNGLPSTNDSAMETSFPCNDAPDADSSSLSYEVNIPSSQPVSVNGDNPSTDTVKESENIEESSSKNEVEILRNDEVGQEIVIDEKDSETVICSTSSSQPPSEETAESSSLMTFVEKQDGPVPEKPSESEPLPPEAVEPVETTEVAVDTNTAEQKDPSEESPESLIVEVAAESETVMETAQPPEETKNSSDVVVDSSNEIEVMGVSGNSNESVSESLSSSSSQVFEDARPTECDTSNSYDSETSNSCELEVIGKTPQEFESAPLPPDESSEVVNEVSTKSEDADSTEVNEAAATCLPEESEVETKENINNSIESEIEASTVESTETEVGECQISHVDQSES